MTARDELVREVANAMWKADGPYMGLLSETGAHTQAHYEAMAQAAVALCMQRAAEMIDQNIPHCCPSCDLTDEERTRLEAVIEDRRGSVRALRALAHPGHHSPATTHAPQASTQSAASDSRDNT